MCCGQVPVDSMQPTSSLRQLSSASFLPSAYANSVGRLDVTANGARPRDALPVSVAAYAERERHCIRFIKPLHIPGATNAPPPGEYGASRLALTYSTTKCSLLPFPPPRVCLLSSTDHSHTCIPHNYSLHCTLQQPCWHWSSWYCGGPTHITSHHIHASPQTNRK